MFKVHIRGLGLWCLMPLLTKMLVVPSKPQYPDKSNVLPQFADIIHHMMLYRVHLAMSGIRSHKRSKGNDSRRGKKKYYINTWACWSKTLCRVMLVFLAIGAAMNRS